MVSTILLDTCVTQRTELGYRQRSFSHLSFTLSLARRFPALPSLDLAHLAFEATSEQYETSGTTRQIACIVQ
jgi:hypothetical protein